MKRHLVLSIASLTVATTTLLGPAPISAAQVGVAKQKLQIVSVSADCIDEEDEDLIVYVTEGEKNCALNLRVTGRGKAKSKISVEFLNEDDRWAKADFKARTTTTTGRTTFPLAVDFPTDPDGPCYNSDSFTYRFVVAGAGKYRVFRSETFEVVLTSADDNPACIGSSDDEGYEDYSDE